MGLYNDRCYSFGGRLGTPDTLNNTHCLVGFSVVFVYRWAVKWSACKWDENGQSYVLPCQGARDQTVGRSHRETGDENRDRLGHPRSPTAMILLESSLWWLNVQSGQCKPIGEHCCETK